MCGVCGGIQSRDSVYNRAGGCREKACWVSEARSARAPLAASRRCCCR
jgi:hypothetical protein